MQTQGVEIINEFSVLCASAGIQNSCVWNRLIFSQIFSFAVRHCHEIQNGSIQIFQLKWQSSQPKRATSGNIVYFPREKA